MMPYRSTDEDDDKKYHSSNTEYVNPVLGDAPKSLYLNQENQLNKDLSKDYLSLEEQEKELAEEQSELDRILKEEEKEPLYKKKEGALNEEKKKEEKNYNPEAEEATPLIPKSASIDEIAKVIGMVSEDLLSSKTPETIDMRGKRKQD